MRNKKEPVYNSMAPTDAVKIVSETERILYPAKKSKKNTAILMQDAIVLCFPRIIKAKKLTTARRANISSKRKVYPVESRNVAFSVEGLTGIVNAKKTAVPKAIALFLSASCRLSSSEKNDANHRLSAQIIRPAKSALAVKIRNEE